ncbi:MAG: hypothetical protein JOZ81_17480 [Chloroflexi bacterium]|nr:hypothetical protein [Chloroflexota bacterium]
MNGDHVLFVAPDGYNFDYWESPYCIPSPDASQVLCGFAQVWTPITTPDSVGPCPGGATIGLTQVFPNPPTGPEGEWYTTYSVDSSTPGMGSISVVVSWSGALGGIPGIVFDDFGPNNPYFASAFEPHTPVALGPSGSMLIADLGAAVLLQDGTECSMEAASAAQVQ